MRAVRAGCDHFDRNIVVQACCLRSAAVDVMVTGPLEEIELFHFATSGPLNVRFPLRFFWEVSQPLGGLRERCGLCV